MNLQELYQAMDADYSVILGRFLTEERIKKYLNMTARDPSFALLRESMEAKDYETAFRAAHTIKGICLNLELHAILTPLHPLVEDLRAGGSAQSDSLFQTVWEQCQRFNECMERLEEGKE